MLILLQQLIEVNWKMDYSNYIFAAYLIWAGSLSLLYWQISKKHQNLVKQLNININETKK